MMMEWAVHCSRCSRRKRRVPRCTNGNTNLDRDEADGSLTKKDATLKREWNSDVRLYLPVMSITGIDCTGFLSFSEMGDVDEDEIVDGEELDEDEDDDDELDLLLLLPEWI